MGYSVAYRFKVDVPVLGHDVWVNGKSFYSLNYLKKGLKFSLEIGSACVDAEVIDSVWTTRSLLDFPVVRTFGLPVL